MMTELMIGEKLKSVFISYARADGAVIAETLQYRLNDVGFSAWLDIKRIKFGDVWYREIEEGIENCATLILCLTAAAIKSEIVLQEWTYARKLGKRIMLIKAEDLPANDIPQVFSKFNWVNNLDREWDSLILQLKEPHTPRPYSRKKWSAGSTSEQIPRLDLVSQIKSLLLDRKPSSKRLDNRKPPMLIALIGAGGQGKTTLAEAVMADKTIQMAFDAGYGLARVDFKAGDVEEVDERRKKLASLISHLSGKPEESATDMLVLNRQLSDAINNDFCLILLDNVWNTAQLEGFIVEGERHVYLITTRSHEVAEQLGIPKNLRVSVGDMTEDEAIAVLTRDSNALEVVDLRENFRKLAKLLSCHPFSLELGRVMIKRNLQRDPRLEAALAETERLYHEKGLAGLDREGVIRANIEISIDALNSALREKFFSFALLKQNIPVRLAVYALYWGGDEQSAVDACVALHNYSLLNYESDTVKFHDILFDYLKTNALDLKRLHQTFLDRLNPERRLLWHEISVDAGAQAYVEDQLVYHLEGAGEVEAIHRLFESENWAHKRDVFGLLRDYRRAKRLATDDATRIRYLFFDEVIQKQYPDLPVEVVIELIRRRQLGDEAAGVLAQSINGMSGDSTAKLDAYVKTMPTLPKEMHSEVLAEAFKFLKNASLSPEIAASAIKNLITMLPPKNDLTDWLNVYWEILLKIETRDIRDLHITHVLGFNLTEAQRDNFLSKALDLLVWFTPNIRQGDWLVCVSVLNILLPNFPYTKQDKTWRFMIRQFSRLAEPDTKAGHFIHLLKNLPEHLKLECQDDVWDALNRIRHWEGFREDDDFFPAFFTPLVPYLSQKGLMAAWERAKNEEDDTWQHMAYLILLPYLSESNAKRVINDISYEHNGFYNFQYPTLIMGIRFHETKRQSLLYRQMWDRLVENIVERSSSHSFDQHMKSFAASLEYFPETERDMYWNENLNRLQDTNISDQDYRRTVEVLHGLLYKRSAGDVEKLFRLHLELGLPVYRVFWDAMEYCFALLPLETSSEGKGRAEILSEITNSNNNFRGYRDRIISKLSLDITNARQEGKTEQTENLLVNTHENSWGRDVTIDSQYHYLRDSQTINTQLWWTTFELSFQNDYYVGGLISLLPRYYEYFDENETLRLKNINWEASVWTDHRLYTGVWDFFDDFLIGLSILILHAPQSKLPDLEKTFCDASWVSFTGFAFAARLKGERQLAILKSVIEDFEPKKSQKISEVIRLLDDQIRWEVWLGMYITYKITDKYHVYKDFAIFFAAFIPLSKQITAVKMALQQTKPFGFSSIGDLLFAIVKQIGDVSIAQSVWDEIERFRPLEDDEEDRFRLYKAHQQIKLALIGLVEADKLFTLVNKQNTKGSSPAVSTLPNSFTYRLDRYLRTPLLGQEYEILCPITPRRVYSEAEENAPRIAGLFYILLLISTLSAYLVFPIISILQVVMNITQPFSSIVQKLLRMIYFGLERFIFLNRITTIIVTPFLFTFVWTREIFYPLTYRYHASFYSMSHKRAREILESMIAEKEPALEFAKRRSLLQRLSGGRLRGKIGLAYHDSVTWWDWATRRTTGNIRPKDAS